MLIEHLLKHVDRHIGFIQQHVVMGGACSSFQCFVRAKVDIVLKRMGNIMINDGAWERVLILVTVLPWEEANVMPLLGHNHCELDLVVIISEVLLQPSHFETYLMRFLARSRSHHFLPDFLDISDLVLDHVKELAFRDSVAEIVDMIWQATTRDICRPVAE